MDDCIFCKIATGEVDSKKVGESENLIVINDANPVSQGHCLIIPKKHYKGMQELPEELGKELIQQAKTQIKRLKEAGLADGVKFVQNEGKAAGQAVMHFHLHVIPEKENLKREKQV